MFRRYIASFAIVLFLVTSGFAQNVEKTGGYARILGMGNNPYVIDPSAVTVNPAWGAVYDNFLFGDLGAQGGGNPGQFVAANFGVGRNFTLGMLLSRNDFRGFSIARLDPGSVVSTLNGFYGGTPVVVPLNNNFELLGTMTFGKTSVGLGVAYASTTNDFTPATGTTGVEGSASQIGFNAGVLAQFTNSLKLDLGASLILPGATFTPETGEESEVSQTLLGVNARLFWKYSYKLSFVPAVSFLTASGTFKNGAGGAPATTGDLNSATVITAGIGINYIVGDFLLAGGPGFAMTSITTPAVDPAPETSNSNFAFPIWNLGLEWNLTDWLVGRLGYFGATNKATSESSNGLTPPGIDESVTTNFVPYGTTVGLGFRFGNFSLDGTVNVEVLHQGLNNIGNFGPTFAYMSASYAIP